MVNSLVIAADNTRNHQTSISTAPPINSGLFDPNQENINKEDTHKASYAAIVFLPSLGFSSCSFACPLPVRFRAHSSWPTTPPAQVRPAKAHRRSPSASETTAQIRHCPVPRIRIACTGRVRMYTRTHVDGWGRGVRGSLWFVSRQKCRLRARKVFRFSLRRYDRFLRSLTKGPCLPVAQ